MRDKAQRAGEILSRGAGEVQVGGKVASWTSYRLGGPADVRFEAREAADLALLSEAVSETGLPFLVVGRGSNMLISDAGFRGIVVRLGRGFRWVDVDGSTIRAGAGTALPSLCVSAAEAQLTGLEFATAIPASLGGAIRMNAGAHDGEMAQVVDSISVWRVEVGRAEEITGRDAHFVYRASRLPEDAVVTAARLRLEHGDPADISLAMESAKAWRRDTQPISLPNGGSVFKNPPGHHAAALVESHVGKATAQGGARISEKHANFIVADPGATASDVHELISRVRRAVLEATGIKLEPEIKLIGFDETLGDSE